MESAVANNLIFEIHMNSLTPYLDLETKVSTNHKLSKVNKNT